MAKSVTKLQLIVMLIWQQNIDINILIELNKQYKSIDIYTIDQ